MDIVPVTSLAPGRCLLTGDIDGPYLDTGFDYHYSNIGESGHVYLHVPLVKQMGREVGMVAPEEVAEKDERIKELEQEVADLNQALMEAEAFQQAIHTIEKKGQYKARKKPGRKPQTAGAR